MPERIAEPLASHKLRPCKPRLAPFRCTRCPKDRASIRGVWATAHGRDDHACVSRVQRRALFFSTLAVAAFVSEPLQTPALPLAPLGKRSDRVGGDKLQSPTVDQVKEILAKDLAEGQYFVTGNLTPEVFADDCRFVDPTNDVTGLSRYRKALTILFDPDRSEVKLKQIRVSGSDIIEADWTLGGYLKLPWQPYIDTIDGHTVYTLNQNGLIQKQEQQWSISALTALKQSFTPSFAKTKK